MRAMLDDSRSITGTHKADAMASYITIGDSQGNLHSILLHEEFGSSTEVGMKKKTQILFAESVKARLLPLDLLMIPLRLSNHLLHE